VYYNSVQVVSTNILLYMNVKACHEPSVFEPIAISAMAHGLRNRRFPADKHIHSEGATKEHEAPILTIDISGQKERVKGALEMLAAVPHPSEMAAAVKVQCCKCRHISTVDAASPFTIAGRFMCQHSWKCGYLMKLVDFDSGDAETAVAKAQKVKQTHKGHEDVGTSSPLVQPSISGDRPYVTVGLLVWLVGVHVGLILRGEHGAALDAGMAVPIKVLRDGRL
jgi:hypothetical protein